MDVKMKNMNSISISYPKTIFLIALMLYAFSACNKNDGSDFKYRISPEAFSEERSFIYQVTPDEAMELMYDSSLALFIDIRSPYDFDRGHLENAINIPIPHLLDPENKTLFERCLNDSLIVVLYGNDELQTNAPWMLIYELGYSNARLLLGGYSYIDRMYLGELKEGESYEAEVAAYDYAKVINDAKIQKVKAESIPEKKVLVKRKVEVKQKPKKAAEGGC